MKLNKIKCERCKKRESRMIAMVKMNWRGIRISDLTLGKLGDCMLCPECVDEFCKFMDSKMSECNKK